MKEARIEKTHKLVYNIVDLCDEYKKLRGFEKMGTLLIQADSDLEAQVQQFQGTMKSITKNRNQAIKFMQEKMAEAERNAELASIDKITEYQKYQKQKYAEIERFRKKDSNAVMDFTPHETDLVSKVEKLQGDLMEIEIKLQHGLAFNSEPAHGKFKEKESNVLNEFNNQCEAFQS